MVSISTSVKNVFEEPGLQDTQTFPSVRDNASAVHEFASILGSSA
jgi:hypothetical protein